MRPVAMFVGCVVGMCLATNAGAQQDRPWWVSFDMGAGQLKLTSDQQPEAARNVTFAMGFAGGHRITSRARVGLHVNGWLLQAFDLNNPTVGESVSNVGGVVDAFPVLRKPLFLRAGVGISTYTNNRPTGSNGSGPGWEAGGGYEIRLPGNLAVAPTVEYAAGGLGNVNDTASPVTGRRYSVVEFKLGAIYRFGGRGK